MPTVGDTPTTGEASSGTAKASLASTVASPTDDSSKTSSTPKASSKASSRALGTVPGRCSTGLVAPGTPYVAVPSASGEVLTGGGMCTVYIAPDSPCVVSRFTVALLSPKLVSELWIGALTVTVHSKGCR